MRFGSRCSLGGSSLAEQMRGSRFGMRKTPPVFGPLSRFLIRSFPTLASRLLGPLSMDLSLVFSKAVISVFGQVSTLPNQPFLRMVSRKSSSIVLSAHLWKVTILARSTTLQLLPKIHPPIIFQSWSDMKTIVTFIAFKLICPLWTFKRWHLANHTLGLSHLLPLSFVWTRQNLVLSSRA